MKTFTKTMIHIAAFAAVTAGVAAAQTTDRFVIDVPFAFHVGNKTMPAGKYSVATDLTSAVWIRNTHGESVTASAPAADKPANPTVSRMVFRVHDDTYYLASIWNGTVGTGKAFPESHAEREMELAGAHTSLASLVVKK